MGILDHLVQGLRAPLTLLLALAEHGCKLLKFGGQLVEVRRVLTALVYRVWNHYCTDCPYLSRRPNHLVKPER